MSHKTSKSMNPLGPFRSFEALQTLNFSSPELQLQTENFFLSDPGQTRCRDTAQYAESETGV